MRKFIATISVFGIMTLGAAFLQSCSNSDDLGCGSSSPVQTSVNFHTTLETITGTTTEEGREIYTTTSYNGSEIDFDKLGMVIRYDLEEIAHNENPVPVFFTNTAKACSPLLPFSLINTISITSDEDFDMSHAAGTDLSDLFYITLNRETGEDNTFNDTLLSGDDLFVRLKNAPLESAIHNLTITINFDNREEVILNIDPIHIRP